MQRRPPPRLILVSLAVVALLLSPIMVTLWQALELSSTAGWALLHRGLVAELLGNTISLVAASTILAGLIGLFCAWATERARLPGAGLWSMALAAPLAVPPFISSYAWVSISAHLQDFAGALLVVTAAYYPLVYLPVASAWRGLDPALEENARALGLGRAACFRRVILPQLWPALLGGMLLVALNVLVEFGAFALLRFRTFTTELYAAYRTGLDGPETAWLACVLLGLCLVCLGFALWLRGSVAWAGTARFTRRPPNRVALGWAGLPVMALLLALIGITLITPLGMIAYWLAQHAAAATSPVPLSWAGLAAAAAASMGLAAGGAALTVVLAFPIAYLSSRYRGRAVLLLEQAAFLPQGMPAIVVALALVFLTVHAAPLLYQSAALLIVAYAIMFLPLAIAAIRSSLSQIGVASEEAGRVLGLGWFGVLRRIVLKLAAPGLGAAAALVFIAVMTELTATLLLAPIGTDTLAIQVWSATTTLAFAAASPYAAVMVAMSLVSNAILARRFGASAWET